MKILIMIYKGNQVTVLFLCYLSHYLKKKKVENMLFSIQFLDSLNLEMQEILCLNNCILTNKFKMKSVRNH